MTDTQRTPTPIPLDDWYDALHRVVKCAGQGIPRHIVTRDASAWLDYQHPQGWYLDGDITEGCAMRALKARGVTHKRNTDTLHPQRRTLRGYQKSRKSRRSR